MQYEGVIPEHRAVRERRRRLRRLAHGRARGRGPAAHASSCSRCSRTTSTRSAPGQAQYTLLTNERGGIVDDLIVYELDAVPLPADRQRRRTATPTSRWLKEREMPRLGRPRRLRRVRAARRPGAARARAARRSPEAPAFTFAEGEVDGVDVHGQPHRLHGRGGRRAARRWPSDAGALWDAVLARGVAPCGLGARDTLRLEVCYPLHGNDITAGDGRDLGRPRLGLRARQGVHRCGGAARGSRRRARSGGSSPS